MKPDSVLLDCSFKFKIGKPMRKKVYDSISEKLLNQEITLIGVAFDSKAGACIQVKNGLIVYIQDLSYWQDRFLKRKIAVTGTFRKKKFIPDVEIDETGAISQGAPGEQYLLENIKEIRINP
jgi:hypothetical protein